jgi:hypothetical protein
MIPPLHDVRKKICTYTIFLSALFFVDFSMAQAQDQVEKNASLESHSIYHDVKDSMMKAVAFVRSLIIHDAKHVQTKSSAELIADSQVVGVPDTLYVEYACPKGMASQPKKVEIEMADVVNRLAPLPEPEVIKDYNPEHPQIQKHIPGPVADLSVVESLKEKQNEIASITK